MLRVQTHRAYCAKQVSMEDLVAACGATASTVPPASIRFLEWRD